MLFHINYVFCRNLPFNNSTFFCREPRFPKCYDWEMQAGQIQVILPRDYHAQLYRCTRIFSGCNMEETAAGRKRVQNPDNCKHKHVKRPGLRKNAPVLNSALLAKVRSDFEDMYYEQQNMYLNGLLRRYETKKTSGHKRKANPATTSSGKRVGRPPAEDRLPKTASSSFNTTFVTKRV